MATHSTSSKIKGEKIHGLHFVTGSDEAEVRRIAQELAMKLAPADAGAFALEIMEATGDTVDQSLSLIQGTVEAILTFPFLSEGKLVWLKGATFLKDSPAGRSSTIQEALEKLLAILQKGLPEGITLLISAPEPDKRRSFYRTLSTLASVTLCDKPDFGFNGTERDIINWVTERAQERGVTLEPEAAEILTARIGANSGQLETELAKLVTAATQSGEIRVPSKLAYADEVQGASGAQNLSVQTSSMVRAPEQRSNSLEEVEFRMNSITATMVRDLVPLTRAGGIFDLGNAISKRDLALSLSTLQQLRRQEESTIGTLLAAIIPTVRNLLLAKELMVRHHLKPPQQPFFFTSALQKLPPEELSHLPRKKDGSLNAYGLGVAAMNAVHFEHEELIKGFLACRDTIAKLLRGQGS